MSSSSWTTLWNYLAVPVSIRKPSTISTLVSPKRFASWDRPRKNASHQNLPKARMFHPKSSKIFSLQVISWTVPGWFMRKIQRWMKGYQTWAYNQSINQSINQSTNQPINQPINQSLGQRSRFAGIHDNPKPSKSLRIRTKEIAKKVEMGKICLVISGSPPKKGDLLSKIVLGRFETTNHS